MCLYYMEVSIKQVPWKQSHVEKCYVWVNYLISALSLPNNFQIWLIFMPWSLMKSACWVQSKPFGAPVSGKEKNNIQ